MFQFTAVSITIYVFFNLNFLSTINTQNIHLCDRLHDNGKYSLLQLQRIRALCDEIRIISNNEDIDTIPDFDLTRIDSEKDVKQILKRFRRAASIFGSRSSSSSSSRSSPSSSSGSGSRLSGSGSSSSSSGSRIFAGGSSSSSGSGSRIFSRGGSSSSSGSGGISSRTPISHSRIFSRSGSSSSSGSGGISATTPSSRIRIFSRSGSSSSGGSRLFSRSTSNTGNTGYRVTTKPTLSGSGFSSGSSGSAGAGGYKPSLKDKIRNINQAFRSAGSSRSGSSGIGGSQFGTAGSGGSGGNVWVRAGKKFLPHAVRFGKRYYQRRKYNKGMYAGMGAGAGIGAGMYGAGRYGSNRADNRGYYPGGQMDRYGDSYSEGHYGYPPTVDDPPSEIDGTAPKVFYCIQEDLNMTLVNQTLNDEGFGVCNISGELVTCPVEIECKIEEADKCCEDEQGTPFCCGGEIPDEHLSQYGGYEDNMLDAAENINKMLNIFTALWIVLATICFTVWQHRGH